MDDLELPGQNGNFWPFIANFLLKCAPFYITQNKMLQFLAIFK